MNRGNYYKYKTRKWFEAEGFFCEYLERNQRIYVNGKVIYIKRDLAGADGMAMKKDQLIFWQCKLNKKNIATAIKEFFKYPYPPFIDRQIIVWTKRARGPEVIEVKDEDRKLTSKKK